MNSLHNHRRRGSMYVLVLGSAMAVTVIGLSAVTSLRINRRTAEQMGDFAQARLYAQSAIDMGLWEISNDPSWRTSKISGAWQTDKTIGTGTYSLTGIDPGDNNLANADSDPLVLTGTGNEGRARYQLQVTLTAEIVPLNCLEVSLHAGNDALLGNTTISCDQIISVNNSIDASSASGTANLEAVNSIAAGAVVGTQTTGITPRTMPDSTVFDYYIANGTPINIASLPQSTGVPTINNNVISPTSNPYGTGELNPEGIYVIDCMGLPISIHDARIVGTIVLLNTSTASVAKDSLNWEPAISNYPALLVKGSFNFRFDSTVPLDETSPPGTNFNPIGTPYNGVEDGLLDDTYPTVIKGLVYVSEIANIRNKPKFEGTVVVGTSFVENSIGPITNLNLTYRQTILNNPPPGFTEPPRMVVSPGTWRQVVN